MTPSTTLQKQSRRNHTRNLWEGFDGRLIQEGNTEEATCLQRGRLPEDRRRRREPPDLRRRVPAGRPEGEWLQIDRHVGYGRPSRCWLLLCFCSTASVSARSSWI